MHAIAALALALTATLAGAAAAAPPHLIFVLADDLGWHSVGFREPSLLTPALDDLRANGVELNSYYAYKFCSPTRASLLTGRWPFKTESTRNNLIPFSQLDGVNTNFTMLPAKLKAAGYKTHGIGKWHQGFWQRAFTPEARGFDSFDGFLAGGQDHFTQESFAECGCKARDVWINGSATADPSIEGTYNAFRFTRRATDVIAAHDAATPLFLYVALQNTHAPIEADASFAALYPRETYATRRDFSAMVSAVDSAVANITAALKAAGLWDNSVLWWASDNGTPVGVGGSNWPLRGSKGSNWEGGVRLPALVGGGALPAAAAGRNLSGLVHVADVYATFCALAGVPPADGEWAPVDGVDAWPYISGANATAPRTRIVHEHRLFEGPPSTGALRDGDWKLIVNKEASADWYGDKSDGHFTPPRSGTQNLTKAACSAAVPCLFNISADPEERADLAAARPDVVAQLLAVFRSYDAAHHPPAASPEKDAAACCAASAAAGNVLAPWG
jgi:arylsulfatase B